MHSSRCSPKPKHMQLRISRTMNTKRRSLKYQGNIKSTTILAKIIQKDRNNHYINHHHQIHISCPILQAAIFHNQKALQHLQRHEECLLQHPWRVTRVLRSSESAGMHPGSYCIRNLEELQPKCQALVIKKQHSNR